MSPPVLSILQDSRNRGGIETVNDWYRRWMERHRPGANVEVYLDDFGPPFAFLLSGGRALDRPGPIPRLLPRAHIPQYLGGRRQLRRLATDAIEAHVMGGVAVHGYLAAGRAPILIWIGTTIGAERRPVIPLQRPLRRFLHRVTLRPLERLEGTALRAADRVLAQSPRTADDVIALGVDASRVEVRPVPVDTNTFRPDDGPRRGLLFVGRALDPRKGFEAALELLSSSTIARDEGLDVISPGGMPAEAAALEAAVRWRGRVDYVAESYRRAKLYLLTSVQEGLGIVVLEALASGTPVVALPSGGADRYINDSEAGYVVRDIAEMKERVEELLADDAARREMGRNGRKWCEENVSATSFMSDPSIFRVGE